VGYLKYEIEFIFILISNSIRVKDHVEISRKIPILADLEI